MRTRLRSFSLSERGGLVQGYEDLNDHDELRPDPTWAMLAGKEEDPVGEDRTREADRGAPPASKAPLGRLEYAPETAGRRTDTTESPPRRSGSGTCLWVCLLRISPSPTRRS